MRVLIVADRPPFAEGLRHLLAERWVDVVGPARDGHEALARARALRPYAVPMDVSMPRLDGSEATQALMSAFPEVTVLMLTQVDDDEHPFSAVAAGVSGYVPKSESTDDFLRPSEGAALGEVAVSAPLAGRRLRVFARLDAADLPDAAASEPLTDRQPELLRPVADGMRYEQVAERVGGAERGVECPMGEVLARLHAVVVCGPASVPAACVLCLLEAHPRLTAVIVNPDAARALVRTCRQIRMRTVDDLTAALLHGAGDDDPADEGSALEAALGLASSAPTPRDRSTGC